MKKIDIYDRERVKQGTDRNLENSEICQRDKELILKFVEYKAEKDSIGILRKVKYICKLRILAEHLKKPFEEATKEDIKKLMDEIYSMDIFCGVTKKKPSISSKRDYAIIIKSFLRWLKGTEHPEEIDWITPPRDKPKRLHPDEILSWEDVVKLSQSAMNLRDKALPQVIWDCGGRIGEVLTLVLKDVEQVNNGDALKLHFRESKTEIRSPVIVRSAPALINWIENHPLRSNKDAPLWVKVDKSCEPMDYATARKVLKTLKAKSGLDKPVNPHNFRKSSASAFSHMGLSEFEVKKRFGWMQSSKMLDVYVFPDEERINDKIMDIEGVKKAEIKPKEEIKSKICQWCNKLNPAGQEYCVLCKRPLNPKENLIANHVKDSVDDNLKEFMEKNPGLLNTFLEFMKGKVGT